MLSGGNIMTNILKSHRGSAMGMAVIIVAGLISGTMYMLKKQDKLQKKVAGNIKRTKVIALEEKLNHMVGFLVASDIIICKQTAWSNGHPGGICHWNSENNGQRFQPSDFSLKELNLTDDKYKRFIVNTADIFGEKYASLFGSGESWIQFKLKNKSEIKIDLGKKMVGNGFDNDDYYIEVMGKLSYRNEGRDLSKQFLSYFRRPIAVPQVKLVGNSACSERCIVSKSQNPNPECRSTFFLDDATPLDINVRIKNLGPGVLYSTTFNRDVSYISGAVVKKAPIAAESVTLNTGDYLVAGTQREAPDQISCATFSQTKTKKVIVSNEIPYRIKPQKVDNPKYFVFGAKQMAKNIFAIIFPEVQAYREWTTTSVDQGTSSNTQISQHSSPAGSVNYSLSSSAVASGSGSLEPLRLVKSLDSGDQGFSGGVQKDTTITKTYKKIVTVHHSH